MNVIDWLSKKCFSFLVQATDLEQAKSLLKNLPRSHPKITESDKNRIISVTNIILNSVDIENPRFDVFVEAMLRLRFLYERYDPFDFHPVFTASFFNDDDKDMWDWLVDLQKKIALAHHNSKQYIPTPEDVQGMRYIINDLNEIVSNDKIFCSEPKQWENFISLEGEPDE